VKGYPFDVILTDGLLVSGAILADQVKSLDWQARQIKKIGALPHKKMQELLQKIGALIL
jgi:mRNA interferase MazF